MERVEERTELGLTAESCANDEITIVLEATVVSGMDEFSGEEQPEGRKWARLADFPTETALDVLAGASEALAPFPDSEGWLALADKRAFGPAVAAALDEGETSAPHAPVPISQPEPELGGGTAEWRVSATTLASAEAMLPQARPAAQPEGGALPWGPCQVDQMDDCVEVEVEAVWLDSDGSESS